MTCETTQEAQDWLDEYQRNKAELEAVLEPGLVYAWFKAHRWETVGVTCESCACPLHSYLVNALELQGFASGVVEVTDVVGVFGQAYQVLDERWQRFLRGIDNLQPFDIPVPVTGSQALIELGVAFNLEPERE